MRNEAYRGVGVWRQLRLDYAAGWTETCRVQPESPPGLLRGCMKSESEGVSGAEERLIMKHGHSGALVEVVACEAGIRVRVTSGSGGRSARPDNCG